ncbi:MAG TPA: endonuclease MutS2 [Gemmatimonadaceae bacterium]|nr:endonuclease MutS2 [Gemmatimonadaceae bacterium]
MNTHALALLDLPRALAMVAERASTALGAAHVRQLEPRTDRGWLDAEHARVAGTRALVTAEDGWSPEPVPDVAPALRRVRVVGAGLNALELQGIGVLLRSARRTRESLADERRPAAGRAVLAQLRERLFADKSAEDAIEKTIDDDARVRDEASPALRRIRRDLAASHGELIRILEREIARLEEHQRVADASVTVRNGRYVMPVRRGAHVVVGGIVHDTSATGATLFVEPPAAIEFGNRIRELEVEEQREVDRILLELTDRIRPHREELTTSLDALVELDSLYARARYAIEHRCATLELCAARDGFAIVAGRHPLLLAQGTDVVPFDLTMESGERTLLVSGPNTGGKTVLLKAVGLLAMLAQCGVPVPVGAGTRLAVFDDVFADIGDEQSIEASLSTFSAHLRNLAEILRLATDRTLVLIDELGSGTDPVEGAALGGAILESLTARGVLTLATTHLGALKQLAGEVNGVVNASLQFDAVALAPTYRLIKGIPGRSYGISIARRLELSADVIARAEERMPIDERNAAALIESLERRDTELAEREREASAMIDDSRARAHRLAEREARVREREREVERASRQEARRYLLEARAEVERTIAELKRAAVDGDEAARAARQQVERMATEQGEALRRMDRDDRAGDGDERRETTTPLRPGDTVSVGTLGGRRGRVVEIRESEAVVAVGVMKLAVPVGTLERAATPEPAERAVTLVGDAPELHAPSEIDLRGLRPEEAEGVLLTGLDSAIRADLKELRIIHGKGTGVLRSMVAEMLRKDTRVRSFRLGAWNEGGTGVTVAEL